MGECTCWHTYPNPKCKKKCLEEYILVENMHKKELGNKYKKTKCKSKESKE